MPSVWVAALAAGTAALGQHLVVGRCHFVRVLPLLALAPASVGSLLAVALTGSSPGRGAASCGHATGSRPLWPGHGRCLCPQALPLQALAMLAGGCTC
ncbi:hypothetical protein GW17_00052362 [Ensete ventricosum]|nr:hypothetical protein GW17_00052362 [Ensete ventricosum]